MSVASLKSSSQQRSEETPEHDRRNDSKATAILRIVVRRAVTGGLPAIIIVAFLVASWCWEQFREGMGVISPYLPILLYISSAAFVVVVAIAVRFAGPRARRLYAVLAPRFRTVAIPVSLAFAMVAYLIPVIGNWETGRRAYSTVAGVVPWSDANGYFQGAQGILFDGELDDWNSRRPINAAFFATRLAFTNLDLRMAIALQALLLGAACFLAARTVTRDLGVAGGLTLFVALFGYASFNVENTLSESLGITLGALAFATLWSAVRARSAPLASAGLYLVGLAVTARAGAFALLLVLPLFFAWHLRATARLNVRFLLIGFGVIVAAVLTNLSIAGVLHGEPRNVNGNFSHTLYGLANGVPGWGADAGWTAVYNDYPEARGMPELEQNRFVRDKALEEIRNNPTRFALSIARSARNYLEYARDLVMAPLHGATRAITYALASAGALAVLWRRARSNYPAALLDGGLFLCSVVGAPVLVGLWPSADHRPTWLAFACVLICYAAFIMVGTARCARPELASFLLFVVVSFVGLFASLPFLGDGGARVLSATAAWFAFPVPLAVALLVDRIRPKMVAGAPDRAGKPSREGGVWWPAGIGAGIVGAALIGAPIAGWIVDADQTQPRRCPDGRRAHELIGGVAVKLVSGEARAEGRLDELDITSFAPGALEVYESLQGLPPGTTILQAHERDGRAFLTVVDKPIAAPGHSTLYLCGQIQDDPGSRLPILFGTPAP